MYRHKVNIIRPRKTHILPVQPVNEKDKEVGIEISQVKKEVFTDYESQAKIPNQVLQNATAKPNIIQRLSKSGKFKLRHVASLGTVVIEAVSEVKETTCRTCLVKIPLAEFAKHLLGCKKSQEAVLKCSVKGCLTTFKTQYARDAHMVRVHSDPVPCPVENCISVVKPAYLHQHFRSMHQRIKGRCENCNKVMLQASLAHHRTSCYSTGEKIFPCTVEGCNKAYKTKVLRQAHITVVHTEPIPCPWKGCTSKVKVFKLGQHIKNKHERVKGTCKFCGIVLLRCSIYRHHKICPRRHEKPIYVQNENSMDSHNEFIASDEEF